MLKALDFILSRERERERERERKKERVSIQSMIYYRIPNLFHPLFSLQNECTEFQGFLKSSCLPRLAVLMALSKKATNKEECQLKRQAR
jgi:hypothetical protein